MRGRPGNAAPLNVHCHRLVAESVPGAARLPSPTDAGARDPVAVVIWGPSPGIGRNPGVSRAGIVCPGAVGEGIPSRAYEVGLPHGAASAGVDEVAVIEHVADAVAIGDISEGVLVGVLLVVVGVGVVPGVE